MRNKNSTKIALKALAIAALSMISVFMPRIAAADTVAKIGDTEYATLAEALADVAEGKPLTWVSEAAWNLAAVPTTESVALDAIAAPASSANDAVIVPTDGAPRVYTVKDGKWGYEDAVQVTDASGKATGIIRVERKTDAKLEPGTGFWYVNGSGEKKVTW